MIHVRLRSCAPASAPEMARLTVWVRPGAATPIQPIFLRRVDRALARLAREGNRGAFNAVAVASGNRSAFSRGALWMAFTPRHARPR
jgi:hypothetical protein